MPESPAGKPCKSGFGLFYASRTGPTRGLRENRTWFEGKTSWSEGNLARGLREKTRGLKEEFGKKVPQNEGLWPGFSVPLLFKGLLFLFCLTTTGTIA